MTDRPSAAADFCNKICQTRTSAALFNHLVGECQ
jgi:hypothetical protein